jgi:hypothetical protein
VPANAWRQEPFFMADNYIIENRPKSTGITVQAGIVVRDGSGFRFFASTHPFNSLEGRYFKSPSAAEHAALRRVTYATSKSLTNASLR